MVEMLFTAETTSHLQLWFNRSAAAKHATAVWNKKLESLQVLWRFHLIFNLKYDWKNDWTAAV